MKSRTYNRPGRHCDSCEQDLAAGSSGHHCKVGAANKQIYLLLYFPVNCSLKVCDYDLCDTCCCQLTPVVPAPPLLGRVSSTRLPVTPVAVVSPFRGAPLALIRSPVRDLPGLGLPVEIINVSSDCSPPPQKIHPFFLTHQSPRAHVMQGTHEMLFHALARQPAVLVPAASPPPPPRRPAGRLRLRVSTPVLPPPAVHTASAPRRNHHRPISSPIEYPDIAGLAISTPPRVGSSQFEPRLLFPNSPSPSPVPFAEKSPELRFKNIAVQTDIALTSAQSSPQPLTLQDLRSELQVLRNELRTLVIAFGF